MCLSADLRIMRTDDGYDTMTAAYIRKAMENTRVREITRLIPPVQIKAEVPGDEGVYSVVTNGREIISNIIHGNDHRFLAIVGPCSIHDPAAAIDYAQRLVALRDELSPNVYLVMRVYFEKPRTTVGWKGLINDPEMNDTCKVMDGLHLARKLLVDINKLGIPTATEFLDPIIPQYTADLVSWSAIGARTTESQTHREMASGLSMPVGFKNGTDGRVQTAVDALQAAGQPHSFLGIDQQGGTSMIKTTGNSDCHLVLRGGIEGPNYQAEQIQSALDRLEKSGVNKAIMVDCSHANSSKNHLRQVEVWNDIVEQRRSGCTSIIGAMLESFIKPGNQPLKKPEDLEYGLSITDACLGWEETGEILRKFS